jgi:hypothetical protein
MITRQERCHGRKAGKGRKLRQRISGVSTSHRLGITDKAESCTTKYVVGLIAGAATLDVTSEVGIATDIATRL